MHSSTHLLHWHDTEMNWQPQARHFTTGKEPQYPLKRMLDVAWCWCGHYVEDKNLLSLLEFKPWIIQQVA